MLKRTFDIFFSLVILLIFLPIFIVIAVFIKLDSKGPVFFRGIRVGLNGSKFKIFKFRTMVVDADKLGGLSTAEDDPRITRVGRLIRKYKFDELPQFINVFKGDMSIVGPRPEVTMEVETYNNKEKEVLIVKPGITDYASLKFHNEGEILKGSSNPHQTYREKIRPEKLRLSIKYIEEQSFWTDLRIIIETIGILIKTRT